ncbi:glutamate-rich protein 1 isoform X2 [Lampris incognitus]|uniref:glutamate-rich protein 1 isoform X2 n=1 Tax=Lampris incognitus TaxID=2546036 RepID=UPI0024B5FC38|nr:glutamate-rich protein 1 isoform X2 [Lampris incognitus]
MAHRREVFQSKVLQKLYPKVSKQEKEPSTPNTVETLAKKPYVKSKAFQSDGVKAQNALPAGRRVYTVLPPPADYKTGAEGSVTVPQPESINIAEDPAESGHENSGESTEVDEKRRRRKRKKRKPTSNERPVQDVAPQVSGSSTAPASTSQNHNPAGEGGEGLTRNKRRKLKKKRHKEKLLSLGLVPRAAALEFTYQREGGKGEEEMEEKRAAEVSEFLRTTMEIYLSDCSVHADKPPVLSLAIEGLLSSIACGNGPPSVLRELHSLKSLVVQKDPDRLAKALEELHNTASMSPDETTSVASLFQYWITDILPMQRDVATGPFT